MPHKRQEMGKIVAFNHGGGMRKGYGWGRR